MSRVRVALGVEVLLPRAEAGQSGVGVVDDLQAFLQHNDGSHISFRILRSFLTGPPADTGPASVSFH